MKDAAQSAVSSEACKADVRALAAELRTSLANDKAFRQAIKEGVNLLLHRPPSGGGMLVGMTDDARLPVRVLFEKGTTVIAMQPHAPLREAMATVRQKFQIPEELELDWQTPDGGPLDPSQSLAMQLRDADWQRVGGCEVLLLRRDNKRRSLMRALKPSETAATVARPHFLRDITTLGAKGVVAPSRVKGDLADEDLPESNVIYSVFICLFDFNE